MKTNIFDKNGVEVKVGSRIMFPYITPLGELTEDADFEKIIEFKYGCVGYSTKTSFVPLMDWMPMSEGAYIPNEGNVRVYDTKCPFVVIG